MTKVLKVNHSNPEKDIIAEAADVLKKGGLVAFPTETVYGLGADMDNKGTMGRLRLLKNRPDEKPFTVHIADLDQLDKFKCIISEVAREIIGKLWPGPVTFIFNTELGKRFGFRFPDDIAARELIRQSQKNIVAPSANFAGEKPPVDASGIPEAFKKKIDLVLDAGPARLGKESTIADLSLSPYKIIREGAVSVKEMADIEHKLWKGKIGPSIKKIIFVCTGNSCRSVMAEGYLKHRLRQIERDDISVTSIGIFTAGGAAASVEAIEIMKKNGIDIGGHRSRPVEPEEILGADLILTMEELHRREIINRFPSKRDRVYLLCEFGIWGGRIQDAPMEVPDPIGMPALTYEGVLNMMKGAIERLIGVLL